MNKKPVEWLPDLEGAIPESAHGNRLSMYLIALEAWRRGITVKLFTIDNPDNKLLVRYSLEHNGKEYSFVSSRGSKLTEEAYQISDNKDETKKFIAKAGVDIPEGKRFGPSSDDSEILTYAKSLGYPIVLKPINENAGKGVFSDIQNEEELEKALVHVRIELNYHDVIVEKHIPGIEYRILIVDGKVIGAVNRIPANVVGNGVNTIEELIRLKNTEKKTNPNLSKKKIEIDIEVLNSIRSLGYELDTILENEERIFLRSKSNASTGGDPIDVTNELTEELTDAAIKACHAIPGLNICGLDMIVDKEKNTGVVIEVNTKPMLGLHVFPMRGESRDVMGPIVDYYFPETINQKKTTLYFDFDSIMSSFISRSINEVVLSPPSLEDLYTKKYIVAGDISGVGYKSWIRKNALRNKLHGNVKDIGNGTTEVLIAGVNKSEVDNFKDIFYKGPEEAEVEEIKEVNWDKPVNIGFEIVNKSKIELKNELKNNKNKYLKQEKIASQKIEELHNKNEIVDQQIEEFKQDLKSAKQKITNLEKQKKQVIKEKAQLEKEKESVLQEREILKQKNTILKNSRSWRITKPLRNFKSLFKQN